MSAKRRDHGLWLGHECHGIAFYLILAMSADKCGYMVLAMSADGCDYILLLSLLVWTVHNIMCVGRERH